jgi:hypothetical protein
MKNKLKTRLKWLGQVILNLGLALQARGAIPNANDFFFLLFSEHFRNVEYFPLFGIVSDKVTVEIGHYHFKRQAIMYGISYEAITGCLFKLMAPANVVYFLVYRMASAIT